MFKKYRNIIFITLLFFSVSAFGQKAMQYNLPKPSESILFQKQDKQRLLDEDSKTGKGRLRCAILLPSDVIFPGDIQPEIIAEGGLWRLQIEASEAEAINLFLEKFQLPKGAELSFYTMDLNHRLPVISSDENPENGVFVTDYLVGEVMIVELFLPTGVKKSDCFTIKDIGYMYRPLPKWLDCGTGFGSSEACEINTNCPEGAAWQNEKHGIARILLVSGGAQYYCSGSLINNARNDRTPYFLTAEHCGEGTSESEYARWKFYFNYESPTCQNPDSDPLGSVFLTTGSEKIAEGSYSRGSDFLLLKLKDEVSLAPDLFFNGWNIVDIPATSGVSIHHPSGDIKKISTYVQPLKADGTTHWRVQWAKTQTNWGVTEGGSSGSPIFNQNRLITGTLTGGDSDCAVQSGYDYYGKMSYHWNKNGVLPENCLKPWLDPDNTGITQLQGIVSSPVGLNNISKRAINVWPNPVDDILFFETKMFDNHEIKIIDIFGRILIRRQFSENGGICKMDLSGLAPGLYVLVIINDNSLVSQKIIKK